MTLATSSLSSSCSSSNVRVEFIDEVRGNICFLTRPLRRGATVLRERPVVHAPSVFTEQGKLLDRLCWTCGRILFTPLQDLVRCKTLLPEALLLTVTEKDAAVSTPYRIIEDALVHRGRLKTVLGGVNMDEVRSRSSGGGLRQMYFCGSECMRDGLESHGLRYLCDGDEGEAVSGNGVGSSSCFPSADAIHEGHTSSSLFQRIATLTRVEAVAVMWHLSDTYNERFHMSMRLISRLLSEWVLERSSSSSRTSLDTSFDERVSLFLQGYAEGAPRTLTSPQRSVLRYFHRVLCHWLSLSEKGIRLSENDHRSTRDAGPVSLQTLLSMMWVFDANVHTYIVTCPLYDVAQRWHRMAELLRRCPPALQSAGGTTKEEEEETTQGTEVIVAAETLRTFFAMADPELLHHSGVALYRTATKFNHSCTPNVKFLPTSDRVEAHVVALEDIGNVSETAAGGAGELMTSYIDVDSFSSTEARRRFLRENYGFDCNCVKCASSE